MRGRLGAVAVLAGCATAAPPPASPSSSASPGAGESHVPASFWAARTRYRQVEVLGHRIFYREAGERGQPTLLLLHGYPSSSHTYRQLIPLLSGRYHVIAPDNLGSGYSDHPDPRQAPYSFDLLAEHVTALTQALKLERYVLHMQDFGAPVGFRVALRHPERVLALIAQNANAYLDGLTPQRREFFRKAHSDRPESQRQQLLEWVSDRAIREGQYLRDAPGERAEYVSPDAWTHDIAMLASPDDRLIQVQLFQDYQTNIDAYPSWQRYLRERRPPTLVLWGERDPAFIADGARAYLRDVPEAEFHLLDAGHFAVEERPVEVAQAVVRFLESQLGRQRSPAAPAKAEGTASFSARASR